MFLHLKKTEKGWVPCDEESVKAFNKQKIDDEIFPEWKPKRNIKFHRKLYALLNAVIVNQDHYKDVKNLLDEVKLRSGHFDMHISHKGEITKVPSSISFFNMDEAQFEIFYSKALDVAIELTDEEAVNEIIKFL